jgi:GntR family transcriptional repressor for pyruvate dehydrogenase complex
MDIFDQDGFKPINRELISVSILNMITENILSGRLKPGDKLPTEFEFAEKLSVSRNSVREAIKMLSSLGVTTVKRGAGTYISKSMSSAILDPLILSLAFEQGTSRELIELRLLIERDAVELAIEKASDEEIQKLEEVNGKLKEAAGRKTQGPHEYRDLDLNVHYTLFELTKNPFFIKIAKTIYRLFFASIEKTVSMNPLRAHANHQLYIDAMKRRDKLLAREKIEEGLSFWIDFVKNA